MSDRQGAKKRKKWRQMPDKRGDPFMLVPHCVLMSPAFRDCRPLARCVLFLIQQHHNGHNNGHIHLSTRKMHEALGTSDNTSLASAIAELVDRGLVEITSPDDFARLRLAREFRLTYMQTGTEAKPVAPTNDYLRWSGPSRKAQRRKRAETSARETKAAISQTARETKASPETTAWETKAVSEVAPVDPLSSAAWETSALLYHTISPTRSAGLDLEWMRGRLQSLLSAAPRGTQRRVAEIIGANDVQLSRMLNDGRPLPEPVAAKLNSLLGNRTALAEQGLIQ